MSAVNVPKLEAHLLTRSYVEGYVFFPALPSAISRDLAISDDQNDEHNAMVRVSKVYTTTVPTNNSSVAL